MEEEGQIGGGTIRDKRWRKWQLGDKGMILEEGYKI
jgi:hypothetical protein